LKDEPKKPQNLKTLSFNRVVDLSNSLFVGMPSWQTNPELLFGPVKRAVRDIFTLSVVTQMHLHAGTHVDAPLHSRAGGKTLDSYSVEDFMGSGVVLDLRSKKAGEEITAQDLGSFDSSIQRRDVVMLCTDWHKRRGMNHDYLYKWPFLGESASRFLVEKQIKAVGTEGMSIAGWTDNVPAQGPVTKYSSAEIHNLLLENDILVIEELSNLGEVLGSNKTARGFFTFAPVKFVGTEASPCRAVAFV
jgi:arylformamidase